MHRAGDLDPAELKQVPRRKGKVKEVPTLEDFISIFPTSHSGDPGQALYGTEQISGEFHKRGWDKSSIKKLRDEAIGQGRLGIQRLAHNRILIGRTEMVHAFELSHSEVVVK